MNDGPAQRKKFSAVILLCTFTFYFVHYTLYSMCNGLEVCPQSEILFLLSIIGNKFSVSCFIFYYFIRQYQRLNKTKGLVKIFNTKFFGHTICFNEQYIKWKEYNLLQFLTSGHRTVNNWESFLTLYTLKPLILRFSIFHIRWS